MLIQHPEPGKALVHFGGDIVTFTLEVSDPGEGEAWIRTDLGRVDISRREVVSRIEQGDIKHNEAWHDLPMVRQPDGSFSISLGLHETGHFRAKCFFVFSGSLDPVWPAGDDTLLNVHPPGSCCANIIYNAFVRQFGPSKAAGKFQVSDDAQTIEFLEKKGYSVIPPSGKFRDLIQEIPFIFGELGCRVLHLLPVHPTPTTYARMGRIGSPYAALNFTDVDPALAEFDPLKTPLEQFMELADAVHAHAGYLILDIAINHTGWAAEIHEKHPEWLVRGPDGKIEVPGAWGIRWEDLTKLDYSKEDLWTYMATIFLLWCRRGVDGFRCDAGYMIPVPAWEYIVAKVRQEFPDTIFFLEGLGGKIQVMCDILNTANFNWAYSELFQNYDRVQLESYLPGAFEISENYGSLIHFAETHDNNRLASVSTAYAKMRTSLSALFSVCGGFGFANGVEWFADQKINVHDVNSLNWGAATNQVSHIRRLNLILKNHPAFFDGTRLSLIQKGPGNFLALLRNNESARKKVLVLANLDMNHPQSVCWEIEDFALPSGTAVDLITGKQTAVEITEKDFSINLGPGEVLALTHDAADLDLINKAEQESSGMPERVLHQKMKLRVLKVLFAMRGYQDISGIEMEQLVAELLKDPSALCLSLNQNGNENRVIPWVWEKDCRRTVMVPPGFFLLVFAPHAFRAMVAGSSDPSARVLSYEESLPMNDGSHFALFMPGLSPETVEERVLKIRIYNNGAALEQQGALLYLPHADKLKFSYDYTRKEILDDPGLKLLGVNRQGGMMRAAAWWGTLESRYDALLAANISSDYPEDRWMLVSRFRIWAVYQGYSRELTLNCLEKFSCSHNSSGLWIFRVPTSEGNHYIIEIRLKMMENRNALRMAVLRKFSNNQDHLLENTKPVTVIIRPDIESRRFHDTVKAYTGPEESWKRAVHLLGNGFVFEPEEDEKRLVVRASLGDFIHEPEWHYMVFRPMEAQRGLDSNSDLFSPGYFTLTLKGGEQMTLAADAGKQRPDTIDIPESEWINFSTAAKEQLSIGEAAVKSLDAFIVNRQKHKSVIAGYPWFLDWGRDSLIFSRALIQAGRYEEAKAILYLFGRYESSGTLPNMISGKNAANRETSDAPLWLFTACSDLYEHCRDSFLDERLDHRTLRSILISMGNSLVSGTPTGVGMDPESCLLYSPSHFTWMDTNFPAGSPRQGYPVEIQALWHKSLLFLSCIDTPEQSVKWKTMAEKVRASIELLFFHKENGYFSDCLHAEPGVSAKKAEPDDALRPNQLFLITLKVIQDNQMKQSVLKACLELLVPGAIRSLADRRIAYPLLIEYNDQLLNDPHYPYVGTYAGDEDRQRKPAYHNGTAWTWPFPVFCEAWADVFAPSGVVTGMAWLGSSLNVLRKGCAGFIPEILDGDSPHRARGCDAQAWGSSELTRVWLKLSSAYPAKGRLQDLGLCSTH